MRKQLKDLSQTTHTAIHPVFVSNKIEQELKVQEKKPRIVNQQCVVYKFQCDLCDSSYVGYKLRHLHQRVNEYKNQSSSIGKHYSDKHCIVPKDLEKQFFVLKKCRNKFDCLVHDMFLIRELTPSLNRLRVVSNFGDGDCGEGQIHARARKIEETRREGSAENSLRVASPRNFARACVFRPPHSRHRQN